MDNWHVMRTKGQLILKCPFGVFKSPKNPTKIFLGFLPLPLNWGQIKKIRALFKFQVFNSQFLTQTDMYFIFQVTPEILNSRFILKSPLSFWDTCLFIICSSKNERNILESKVHLSNLYICKNSWIDVITLKETVQDESPFTIVFHWGGLCWV